MKAEPACPHLTHTTETARWREKAQVAPFIFNVVIFNNGNLCWEPMCPKRVIIFPCQWVVSWCQAEIKPLPISSPYHTTCLHIFLRRTYFYSRNLIFRLAHVKFLPFIHSIQFLPFIHFLMKNVESRSLQSHLSIPAVTTTFLLFPPLIMPSGKAAVH